MKNLILHSLKDTNAKYSFVIKNLLTGEVWSWAENEKVPSASLIKLPLLVTVMMQVQKGHLGLNQRIKIDSKDITPYSVLEFFDPGVECSIRELLKLMIIYSDNTATNILFHHLGFDLVNSCLKTMGLHDTVARRFMMDIEAGKAGRENITTAHDMATLLEALYQGQIIDPSYSRDMLEIMKGQCDECMMRRELPDEIPIARKSGELLNLDHDIAIVYGKKTDYLYVFFVSNATSNNEARDILARTSKIAYDYFEG